MEEVDIPFTAIRLKVLASGPASEADIARVGEETAKFCPISKLYEKAGTKLEVTWAKA